MCVRSVGVCLVGCEVSALKSNCTMEGCSGGESAVPWRPTGEFIDHASIDRRRFTGRGKSERGARANVVRGLAWRKKTGAGFMKHLPICSY